MQSRRAVQENRVLAYDLFEYVPDHGLLPVNHLARLLDGRGVGLLFELVVDEGLEQLQGHLLRQAALMELEFGADDDDGAARIVNALAEQILTEASLLALQRVAQGFERAVVDPAEHATAASVVEQGVHGLLKHALLVAHDDFGRAKLHELLQTVVAVDDAAVAAVQVGPCQASAALGYERT